MVVLKGGRTSAGGRAAASHTAALAGTSRVWEAALAQSGALAVGTVEELIDMLIAFSYIRPGGVRRAAHRPTASDWGWWAPAAGAPC